jgi:hypothetical protein
MVGQSLPQGIGALSSTKARFFHSSDKIREKWPQDNKRLLDNVLIIGEGQRRVNKKDQWCYIVCLRSTMAVSSTSSSSTLK